MKLFIKKIIKILYIVTHWKTKEMNKVLIRKRTMSQKNYYLPGQLLGRKQKKVNPLIENILTKN